MSTYEKVCEIETLLGVGVTVTNPTAEASLASIDSTLKDKAVYDPYLLRVNKGEYIGDSTWSIIGFSEVDNTGVAMTNGSGFVSGEISQFDITRTGIALDIASESADDSFGAPVGDAAQVVLIIGIKGGDPAFPGGPLLDPNYGLEAQEVALLNGQTQSPVPDFWLCINRMLVVGGVSPTAHNVGKIWAGPQTDIFVSGKPTLGNLWNVINVNRNISAVAHYMCPIDRTVLVTGGWISTDNNSSAPTLLMDFRAHVPSINLEIRVSEVYLVGHNVYDVHALTAFEPLEFRCVIVSASQGTHHVSSWFNHLVSVLPVP